MDNDTRVITDKEIYLLASPAVSESETETLFKNWLRTGGLTGSDINIAKSEDVYLPMSVTSVESWGKWSLLQGVFQKREFDRDQRQYERDYMVYQAEEKKHQAARERGETYPLPSVPRAPVREDYFEYFPEHGEYTTSFKAILRGFGAEDLGPAGGLLNELATALDHLLRHGFPAAAPAANAPAIINRNVLNTLVDEYVSDRGIDWVKDQARKYEKAKKLEISGVNYRRECNIVFLPVRVIEYRHAGQSYVAVSDPIRNEYILGTPPSVAKPAAAPPAGKSKTGLIAAGAAVALLVIVGAVLLTLGRHQSAPPPAPAPVAAPASSQAQQQAAAQKAAQEMAAQQAAAEKAAEAAAAKAAQQAAAQQAAQDAAAAQAAQAAAAAEAAQAAAAEKAAEDAAAAKAAQQEAADKAAQQAAIQKAAQQAAAAQAAKDAAAIQAAQEQQAAREAAAAQAAQANATAAQAAPASPNDSADELTAAANASPGAPPAAAAPAKPAAPAAPKKKAAAKTAPVAKPEDLNAEFAAGKLRLPNDGDSATLSNAQAGSIMSAAAASHDGQVLSKAAIQSASGNDLGYYYLGVAAQDSGNINAARTYYQLSLLHSETDNPPAVCSPRHWDTYQRDLCHGILLPNSAAHALDALRGK